MNTAPLRLFSTWPRPEVRTVPLNPPYNVARRHTLQHGIRLSTHQLFFERSSNTERDCSFLKFRADKPPISAAMAISVDAVAPFPTRNKEAVSRPYGGANAYAGSLSVSASGSAEVRYILVRFVRQHWTRSARSCRGAKTGESRTRMALLLSCVNASVVVVWAFQGGSFC